MPEYEREIKGDKNFKPTPEIRFVSDAERARRIPSNNNHLGEIVDHGGNFNSLDGTHPHSQEEANAADKAYLAQGLVVKGKEPLVSRAIRSVKRAIQPRKS